MQNIGGTKNPNASPDIVLVQAEGDTGENVDRAVEQAKALNEQRKEMGQLPDCAKAMTYGQGGWSK
jgi:hypothetical protein